MIASNVSINIFIGFGGLWFFIAQHQQHNSPSQRERSEDWRQWNGVGSFGRDLQRTEVHGLVGCPVSDSLVGQRKNSSGDQDDCDNWGGLHGLMG